MYIPTQAKNNTVRFVEDIVNEALKFLVDNKTTEGSYPIEQLDNFFTEHSYASDRTIQKYKKLTLARVKFLA